MGAHFVKGLHIFIVTFCSAVRPSTRLLIEAVFSNEVMICGGEEQIQAEFSRSNRVLPSSLLSLSHESCRHRIHYNRAVSFLRSHYYFIFFHNNSSISEA